MIQNLIEDIKQKFSVYPSIRYVEKILSSQPAVNAQDIYKKILSDNLNEVVETSLLPFGLASQVRSTIPNSVMLQISTSRDATQPLRPSADATAEEIALYGSGQKNSPKRLLKLLLTDGISNIVAFELSTLRIFRNIPTPGEKLLIKAGAEVKNGSIILSDEHVVLLGGGVYELKKAFLDHHQRVLSTALSGYQTSTGLEGAPKFQPLSLGLSEGNSFEKGFGGERKEQFCKGILSGPQGDSRTNQNARSTDYNWEEKGKNAFKGRGNVPAQRGGRGRRGATRGTFNHSFNNSNANAEELQERFLQRHEQETRPYYRGGRGELRGNGRGGRGRSGRGRWHRGGPDSSHADPVSEPIQ